ncbi:MAG: phage virion morphogenesis protein [Pseudomonadota bacterium]
MIRTTISQDEIETGLARLGQEFDDMTELMQDLGEVLQDATQERFTQGTAPDGTPWAPKSQATIDGYRRGEGRGRNAPVDFRPLFGPSKRLSSEIHYVASPQSVEVGSSLIYSAVQQLGASKGAFGTASNGSQIPWGDIPARPFLGISDEDETGLRAAVEEWLMRITDASA